MEDSFPCISVIIPAKPECDYIKALKYLKKVNYPAEKLEILISKGYNPSLQRNKAAQIARGEILYFLDDDSIVSKDIFLKTVFHYKNKDISGVGGPSIAHPDESKKQQLFSSVLSSQFGGFGITSRYKATGKTRRAKEEDLILCNFSIRKEIFVKFNGFNEKLYPNEENEFYNRLLQNNVTLIYNPSIKVYRFSRKSFKDFFLQIFKYGKSRMEHIILKPEFFRLKYFIPMFFLLYCLFLVFHFIKLKKIDLIFIPFFFYLMLNIIFSFKIFLKKKDLYFLFMIPLTFFVLHISYGLGSICGIINGFRKRIKDIKIDKNVKIEKISL